jgi:hypothetical protein
MKVEGRYWPKGAGSRNGHLGLYKLPTQTKLMNEILNTIPISFFVLNQPSEDRQPQLIV